jgi:NtrC-family two-component system sensor histidine kinase KinB
MSLKTKLIIAFGGLLAILVVVGTLTVRMLNESGKAIDRILRENYDTIVACYKMQDALERLDRLAELSLWQKLPDLSQKIEQAEQEFYQNLKFQQGNVTVPGEQKLTDGLTTRWLDYRRKLENFYQATADGKLSLESYRHILLPSSQNVREATQQIIELNLQNMVSADGQLHKKAAQTRNAMLFLLCIGIAGGLGFMVLMGPAILQPLARLTGSVREIQKGNLDLIVTVSSHDEIGQLSQAFNDMAASLREFRRSDQAQLLRTQRSTQLALNSLNDAVAICDPGGKIELANDAAQQRFGLKPGALVAEAENEQLYLIFQRVCQEEHPYQPRNYEGAIQIFVGEVENFYLPQAIPIFDEVRRLVGVTLMLADVTRLRRLDELKTGIISTVSHELKTPLTSVRLAIHVLLSEKLGTLSAKQMDLLEAARQDSDRLYRVIEDLLELSHLESGRAEIQLQQFNVEDLLLQVVEKNQTAFVDQGVELNLEPVVETRPVLVDPIRIGPVFDNLLNNALKFTPRGGQVRLSAQPEGALVRFTVEDTGKGIPPEYLPRIFDKFFRVPGQEQADSGLGLSIAKEFVEAQGGSITVSSELGQGTIFSFTLKTAPAPETALDTPKPDNL